MPTALTIRSRFRLTLEVYACAIGAVVAQALAVRWQLFEFIFIGALYYAYRLSKSLNTRREPFTRGQKNTLSSIQLGISALIVVPLLVGALVRETALLWIVFGLTFVMFAAGLYYGYDQLYGESQSERESLAGKTNR